MNTKNNIGNSQPSRFIFGEGIISEGQESIDYVVHTQSPRFICRIDEVNTSGFDEAKQSEVFGLLLHDKENKVVSYVCNQGYRLSQFNFLDTEPVDDILMSVCDAAIVNYLSLWNQSEKSDKTDSLITISSVSLPADEHAAAVNILVDSAQVMAGQPEKEAALQEVVRCILQRDDYAIFTEAQWRLTDYPAAEYALIQAARNAIASTSIASENGESTEYELWALPMMLARDHAGIWWHFAGFGRLSAIFSEVLGIETVVSTTAFTFKMLQETACQALIHLPEMIRQGKSIALYDPVSARALYKRVSQQHAPHLSLCWMPVWFKKTDNAVEKIDRLASSLMDEIMPVVQSAVSSQMDYAEIELFTPQPWWSALSTVVNVINHRRLSLFFNVLSEKEIDADTIKAKAVYQPENLAYAVSFENTDTEPLAEMDWWLVPDLAPNRKTALNELESRFHGQSSVVTEAINPSVH